jgi:hypothetical protein
MKRCLLAGLVIFLSSCATFRGEVPQPLLGHWASATGVLSGLPVTCINRTLEFTADGHLTVTSGALVYVTSIKVSEKDGGFLVSLSLVRHNGQRNCQGLSAKFVTTHLAALVLIRVEGDRLSYVTVDENLQPDGPSVEFRRVGV